MESHGTAHGTYRSATNRARRTQRPPAWGTVDRACFAKVYTSPLQRATRTCELAGFRNAAEADRDLVEWNYGKYEGLRTTEIHAKRPGWQLFRDGCPDGESPDQVGLRADRVVSRVRAIKGDVLIFSSGHFLRVFAAR
jgi:broad specificity phosphatase PhoE